MSGLFREKVEKIGRAFNPRNKARRNIGVSPSQSDAGADPQNTARGIS